MYCLSDMTGKPVNVGPRRILVRFSESVYGIGQKKRTKRNECLIREGLKSRKSLDRMSFLMTQWTWDNGTQRPVTEENDNESSRMKIIYRPRESNVGRKITSTFPRYGFCLRYLGFSIPSARCSCRRACGADSCSVERSLNRKGLSRGGGYLPPGSEVAIYTPEANHTI
jgi:hypothetical protein